MGNSKSKRDTVGGGPSSGDVVRRQNPNHAPRPLSDPGVSATADPLNLGNNFSMRPNADLSGQRYGREITRLPTEEDTDYHGESAPLADRHREFGRDHEPRADYLESRHPPANGMRPTLDDYHRYLSQLVASRPEFEPLRTLDFSVLPSQVLDTLAQVYKRLYEQQDMMKSLSDGRRNAERQLRDLEDERNTNLQQLRLREQDIDTLKEDIAILSGELRKRGYDARVPSETDGPDRIQAAPRADDYPSGKKGKEGIYLPTPLTQAMGAMNEERKRRVVERVESLRPVGQVKPEIKSTGYRALSESSDSSDGIRKLELALEREKKENAALRERLETSENKGFRLARRSFKPEMLTENYRELDSDTNVAGKVMVVVRHHLGHVDDHRQRQFLCSVMQTAADLSSRTVRQFRDTVHSLLLDPVKLDVKPQANGDVSSAPNRALIKDKAKQFEVFPEPSKMSALAARTLELSKVPEALSQQINTYLENMADSINLTSLTEGVVQSLKSQFNECVTPALVNHATFHQFLYECCRLAWQMAVINPPLYVTIEDDSRFDDRSHVAFQQENVITNTIIDYYVWPTLFNKKDGDVLHKGRVYLKA